MPGSHCYDVARFRVTLNLVSKFKKYIVQAKLERSENIQVGKAQFLNPTMHCSLLR